MARIDFYVLSHSGEQARQAFACRLAEKAYRLDNTVYIQTPDREAAERMDDLLWTFRDGSFVPHRMLGRDPRQASNSPVTIGCEADGSTDADLLINLCDEVPVSAPSFPRIAELVTSDEDAKTKSRKRFAAYRDQGHEIETHKL